MFQECCGDVMVKTCGCDNGNGIDLTEQWLEGIEAASLAFSRNGSELIGVAIDDADEFDIVHLREDTGMMLPEVPHSDDSHSQPVHAVLALVSAERPAIRGKPTQRKTTGTLP